MCLMLYLGCNQPVPAMKGPWLTVEDVPSGDAAIRQWFTKKHVYFIGSHTGCSCGFPSVCAAEPLEYFDGMFADDGEERCKDVQSMSALIGLLRTLATRAETVELLPAWWDNRGRAPRGRLRANAADWDARTAFFNEDYMYELSAEPGDSGNGAHGTPRPAHRRDPEK